jgi:hypothetical protein
MKKLRWWVLLQSLRTGLGLGAVLWGMLCSPQAQAAYSCNLSSTPIQGIYSSASNLNLSGTVTVSCTRALTDPNTYNYAITLDNGVSGTSRRLYRHGGSNINASRINHSISRISFGGTNWSTSTNAVTGTLNFGSGTSTTANRTYYLRVTSGQTGKTVGIYDDVLTFSLRQGSATGPLVATSSITPTVSIQSACFVGTLGAGNFAAPGTVAPSTLTLNYTSFSRIAVSNSMAFTIDCTQGTPYTLSLSPASGTLLGLPYSLSLGSSSGSGSGFAQSVTVTGTIAAGQSGNCALASCSATQATTVTITY